LVRPGLVPVVPHVPGLRFQAVHTDDIAEAYRLAIVGSMRGAFNIAAGPVIDTELLAELLDARPVRTPSAAVRAALATAWRLRLTPASPWLYDLARHLPLMNVSRARAELGWTPRHSATDAIREFLAGLRTGQGLDTPPLDPATSGPLRSREITTGVGKKP
jgi:UDP-glucose 4-epimerase